MKIIKTPYFRLRHFSKISRGKGGWNFSLLFSSLLFSSLPFPSLPFPSLPFSSLSSLLFSSLLFYSVLLSSLLFSSLLFLEENRLGAQCEKQRLKGLRNNASKTVHSSWKFGKGTNINSTFPEIYSRF